MGRSRGGLTTKIHAMVDAAGLPITLKLTEGQAHDGRSAQDMLDSVRAGNILLADRAYDSDALRQNLAERGAWPASRQPATSVTPAYLAISGSSALVAPIPVARGIERSHPCGQSGLAAANTKDDTYAALTRQIQKTRQAA